MSEVKRQKTSARIAIRAYYLNGQELTEKQEAIRQRWSAAFSLLCNYHSINQAVPLLQGQFDISEAQAYRDIQEAVKLFGNVLKSEKEGHRYIVYEFAVKTYQLAAKNGDYKAMSQSVANMIKLMGLDRDDPELPDFQKMQPSINVITVDKNLIEKIHEQITQGPILKKRDDYIEYDEISD